MPELRCGAVLRPGSKAEQATVFGLAENAARNGVAVTVGADGALEVPGEAVTDPVAYTLALAGAAV
ncbi:MAG: putative dehydrogenase, partial [Solirubrobacterales bacterium]|nr:putative dehydrogenase [Solirubrobacterales bacterium]